ncbi:protein-L-isoaspartate and D-aspartate O-methyltransferase [Caldisphaera lagunensis DSM 15908]|uniref:Protein-L-isoaspartate O-methyltransferase n=1 Tax=Caldisphaera lagunensis (strain DSM 15908 / JCM 11604 / ANMR 0165 / IC-154) TaxID=1056495 RepID=L0ADE0_CALLD|nr:protein-L-isoaspartate O-methyltransferase [Caldisphaera lagunensis]AFZ71127.1 protein-L-isoaspartate and D-aspartate O-methyltransferase [Caldisphaera lagunensis DSM 15908]
MESFNKKMSLINYLKNSGFIKTKKVEEALINVDRANFVLSQYLSEAYEDKPLPIGYGQTISAPSIVAYMTELLEVNEGNKILEIGTGSGYQTAILSYLVKEKGLIVSIERIKELSEMAYKNLERLGLHKNVKLIVGDGSLGYEEEKPYDRIIITAATPVVPKFINMQLKNNGIAILPLGTLEEQKLAIIRKDEFGNIELRYDISVIFVPLIGYEGFKFGKEETN